MCKYLQKMARTEFAVILFVTFEELSMLLTDEEKLADYLDYLHMQKVKEQQPARLKLAEVKAALDLD